MAPKEVLQTGLFMASLVPEVIGELIHDGMQKAGEWIDNGMDVFGTDD